MYTEIKRLSSSHVVVIMIKDKYVGELKRKIPVEYILFERDHVIDLLSSTPSCVLTNEPRLQRLLAKKVHRNTRTLRASDLPDQSDENQESFAQATATHTEVPVPRVIIASERIVRGESDVVASNPVVLQPCEIYMKRQTRIFFSDLKENSASDTELSVVFSAQQRPYDVVAKSCFSASQAAAHTLHIVSNVLANDPSVSPSICSKAGTVPCNLEPDGAGFTPTVITMDNIAYVPPVSTLLMSFNCGGLFLIV
jgi:hypothetical protein